MKLVHRRRLAGLGGPRFESVTHYSLGDDMAQETAERIRKAFPGAKVRVVHDRGPGWTHVFVEEQYANDALQLVA